MLEALNKIHDSSDLDKLEEKWSNSGLVVVGVHR